MIPEKVMEDCRIRSKEVMNKKKPINRAAAVVIIFIWLMLIVITIALVVRATSAK
jgi:predicted nucleic acid-binding Zn ribbon protein